MLSTRFRFLRNRVFYSSAYRNISMAQATSLFREVSVGKEPERMSEAELRRCYLELAKKYHPDRLKQGKGSQKF